MRTSSRRSIVRYAARAALYGCLALTAASAGGAGDRAERGVPAAAQNTVVLPGSDRLRLEGDFTAVNAYLAHERSALRGSTAGRSRATYLPALSQPGYYEVYLWWPHGVAGAGEADVAIQHSRGVANLSVDQRVLAGQWNSLGVFQLDGNARVQLASRPGQALVADAARFEFLGTEPPPLEVRDPALPVVAAGSEFSAVLRAAGGRAPYAWSVAAGTLPPGLALDGARGTIAGSAPLTGHYELTLRVVDAEGAAAERGVSIDVVEYSDDAAPGAGETMPAAKNGAASASPSSDKALAGPDLSGLIDILAATPEGSWARVNLNRYSEVWTPAELRPLKGLSNPSPGTIILAWSSFAWDRNAGDLLIYGGGHANYSGNDVYRWRGTTRMWERLSLPSEIRQDDLGNWTAVDGPDAAPASAHTYDNNIFFPLLNRLIIFGGAAYNNGGPYLRQATATTSRKTGPYVFDQTRGDPNKVGGTTGSHVRRVSPHPEIVGGNMWQNRDMYVNLPSTTRFPATHIAGCTAYAEENGKDVAYVGANSGSTALALYRYSIGTLGNPTTDSWTQVGRYWNAGSDQPACGYDPERKLFVRTTYTGGKPFAYWNLNTPGVTNNDVLVQPTDPTGEFQTLLSSGSIKMRNCGLDFDPVGRKFVLWCGDGRVWMLTPPATVSATGWTIEKQPPPLFETPNGDVGTGIIGKWKYIENLDAFMGLQDANAGNVWLYKPVGWQSPSGSINARPAISITNPAPGTQVPSGQSVTITTSASDPDGTVTKVEFFSGSTKIGQTLAQPHTFVWVNPPAGPASLTALATDNSGAKTLSDPVAITVLAGASGTLVLQDGANGYSSTRDTYLSTYHTTLNFGTQTSVISQRDYYTDLFQFAIFAREGGPVPDAATIQSATLSLYKSTTYDTVFNLHRMLKSWSEGTANWSQRTTGIAWGAPGASASDVDFRALPDAQASIGWNPGWVEFDVTAAVRDFAGGQPNFGWRVRGVAGNVANGKRFNTREFASDAALRPKLTVTYSAQ